MNSLTIAWNMIRQIAGTKKGALMHIFLPCIVIALAVFLMGQDNYSQARILYVNEDVEIASAHLLDELGRKSDYVLKEIASESELKEQITANKGEAGFVIPKGFTESMFSGKPEPVRMYELKASEASSMLRVTLQQLTRGIGSAAGLTGRSEPTGEADMKVFGSVLEQMEKHNVSSVKHDLELYPKPGLNVVTGFTLMFLMGLINSTVSKVIEDRRRRTMARVFSTPVRAWEITLGNFLGSFAVGISQIALVLLFSGYVLRYDYDVPLLLHFLVLGAFMLVSMGIASAIAGLIRNPQNAGMINSLIITPTCMLGGCFWPISFMPDFMQKAANFVPQKWAIEAVEKLSEGGSTASILLPLGILGLMAIILLAIGSTILRPAETNVN